MIATGIAFAARYWKLIGIGLLLLALGVQTWRLSSAKETIEDTREELRAERAASALFAERVKATSERIQRAALENARRVETRQNEISTEVAHDYQARIAALRSDYDRRLRNDTARRTNPGGGGNGVPGTAPAAVDPDGAAPAIDPFAAEANTIQLEELQRWVRETLMVPQVR